MSLSEKLRHRLTEDAAAVEKALAALPMFRESDDQAEHCGYSLGAGGKRLRPFLVIESCRALSGDCQNALASACAVEMIHTYSLIHDDLPGMDDDDLRRGVPSLHLVCGTEKALFAGDRLLMEAFRTLIHTPLQENQVRYMVKKLTQASGASFLTGGQFMDMFHPGSADREWTERMIQGKTAAMIRVSMELGALSAGFPAADLPSVSSIGDRTGWLFQLTDDILDVTGSVEEMGKAVSKDSDMGKWNPVSEFGLDEARKLAYDSSQRIMKELKTLPGDWTVIGDLVEYLPERRN